MANSSKIPIRHTQTLHNDPGICALLETLTLEQRRALLAANRGRMGDIRFSQVEAVRREFPETAFEDEADTEPNARAVGAGR
jgi:hypothetical protein